MHDTSTSNKVAEISGKASVEDMVKKVRAEARRLTWKAGVA